MDKVLKSMTLLCFGIIVPVVLLIQAYSSTSSLAEDVKYSSNFNDLHVSINIAKKQKWDVNDYALYSLLYTEQANLKTMLNKQQMKISIVCIGFAVISIGLMMIILGITASEGVEINAKAKLLEFEFDLKTSSVGAAIFVIGAIMATLGGVLKNEYQTSSIPSYSSSGKDFGVSEKEVKSIQALYYCKENAEDLGACLSQLLFQIYKEDME